MDFQTGNWAGYDLRLSVESGRLLRVYLNGEKVIEYELPRRAPAARFGLWSATFCHASFTQVTPAIPLADVNSDRWYSRFRGEQGGGSVLPTYYKGVFRRDLAVAPPNTRPDDTDADAPASAESASTPCGAAASSRCPNMPRLTAFAFARRPFSAPTTT